MYSTCLNESSLESNGFNKTPVRSSGAVTSYSNRKTIQTDAVMCNSDPNETETQAEVFPSHRSLNLSTSASKRLIAAANAACSVQQQEQNLIFARQKQDTDGTKCTGLTTGAGDKSTIPDSSSASVLSNVGYSDMLQDVLQSNLFVKLLQEVAKSQSSHTRGQDNPPIDLAGLINNQFLKPQSMDPTTVQVEFFRN